MGYIGFSRSENSQSSIDNYEIPLSMFKKETIKKFLEDNKSEFSEDKYIFLNSVTIKKWKYVAKNIGSSSWHHTSKFYNKTNHYDLKEVANELINSKDDLESLIIKKIDTSITDYYYGLITVAEFNGRKYIGTETYAGIIIGNWFYYLIGEKLSKFRTDANKVNDLNKYKYYLELIDKHSEYSSKEYFNKILKIKNLNEINIYYEKLELDNILKEKQLEKEMKEIEDEKIVNSEELKKLFGFGIEED